MSGSGAYRWMQDPQSRVLYAFKGDGDFGIVPRGVELTVLFHPRSLVGSSPSLTRILVKAYVVTLIPRFRFLWCTSLCGCFGSPPLHIPPSLRPVVVDPGSSPRDYLFSVTRGGGFLGSCS